MNDTAISVKNLGKLYKIGTAQKPYKTFRETITEKIKGTSKSKKFSDFWALKDVCFEIKKGEVIGVIGRNGAGKSTLLKILSRITEPTLGEVDLRGRVGSLLEVGTGFHPELTGRENIYLNGAVIGMKRREIAKKFDEIVSFSELEKFVDTPVKHYSSGMYMRLAFAVAAHMETEILLIDEVLAVGDFAFQKKCLGKMGDMATSGRTVLFVSHDMSVISSLTTRCLALNSGVVTNHGKTEDVVRAYLANSKEGGAKMVWNEPRPGDSSFEFISCAAGPGNKEEFESSEAIEIQMEFKVKSKITEGLRIGFDLLNESGVHVFRAYHDDAEKNPGTTAPGTYRTVCVIPKGLLNQGRYFLTLRAAIWGAKKIAVLENAVSFSVINISGNNSRYGSRPGILNLWLGWKTERTPNVDLQ